MEEHDDLLWRLRKAETRRDAFAEVVRRYSPMLYTQIRRLVRWHEDADDVLQNTLLKAWNSIEKFRGEAQLSSWLYRIAINESMNFLQKKQTAETLTVTGESAVAALESDPFFDGDRAERLLQEAIDSLPGKQRLVFCMRYFDEKKYEEMSRILQTSVGALKASYHIAAKKIEAYIENAD